MSSMKTLPRKHAPIKLPTAERLRELLAYDPETGVFRWKVARGGPAKAGSVAGSPHGGGYRRIVINCTRYLAHRLAWKMVTGKDPVATIDHINNDPDDNRIVNLREATRSHQRMNTTPWGSSKYLGVGWRKARGKWDARIRVNGKLHHLGHFDCEIEAARVYDIAAAEHFGEYANLNFPAGS